MLTPSPNGARWPEPQPLANPGRFSSDLQQRVEVVPWGGLGADLAGDVLAAVAVAAQRIERRAGDDAVHR
ncbi:MAG TPA: hypothetical protein VJT72_05130, partial [Pseudonocardiaceae bacterium]|nr:hypothetical protein [Pseudonocardiaceae bacterium]